MPRNMMSTTLQKTYDDSYLSCSTAVFYESQGNEYEAMRYWRSALDRIGNHHTRRPTSMIQSPHDEAETALVEALRVLKLQCRERIDLLEALQASRQERPDKSTRNESSNPAEDDSNCSLETKSIGQGTIPAVTYRELSRPILPERQSFSSRSPLENTIATVNNPNQSVDSVSRSAFRSRSLSNGPKHGIIPRPSSPEKHSMRTTLRKGRTNEKFNKAATPLSSKTNGEGSSKAATLAWNTYGSRDAHQSSFQNPSSPSSLAARHSTEQMFKSRSSPCQWESTSRRLVLSGDKGSSLRSARLSTIDRHSSKRSSPSQSALLSVTATSNALDPSPISEPTPFDTSHRSLGQSSASNTMLAYSVSSSLMRGESVAPSWNHNANEPSERQPFSSTPLSQSASRDFVNRSSSSPSGAGQRGSSGSEECPHLHSPLPQVSDDIEYRKREKGNLKTRQHSSKACFDERLNEEISLEGPAETFWAMRKSHILNNLPFGIDEAAARQIINDIVVHGDEVHWGDIAGLEIAKNALREAVVYPFLRPDLFMGLREPARGMLLFGPPGTGKTMLARAVATESRSTFFSISASSLTSKYLGESEKLVKALFHLARALAPSIIFVDEIDSLLSQRSGTGEHEATRRIKTEFLIQWSDLQRAAAGREMTVKDRERGDANRVLVLAATNLPWVIDEAARRRFVRRQYIPLPEATTREKQLKSLLGQQKHGLSTDDLNKLVQRTEGFSGSDITALAKDAAMGPLRSLGEALLHMNTDDIRPIQYRDFEASLGTIRPSVSKSGLEKYEAWAKEFGERGG